MVGPPPSQAVPNEPHTAPDGKACDYESWSTHRNTRMRRGLATPAPDTSGQQISSMSLLHLVANVPKRCRCPRFPCLPFPQLGSGSPIKRLLVLTQTLPWVR